jgi:hypothetical protein
MRSYNTRNYCNSEFYPSFGTLDKTQIFWELDMHWGLWSSGMLCGTYWQFLLMQWNGLVAPLREATGCPKMSVNYQHISHNFPREQMPHLCSGTSPKSSRTWIHFPKCHLLLRIPDSGHSLKGEWHSRNNSKKVYQTCAVKTGLRLSAASSHIVVHNT